VGSEMCIRDSSGSYRHAAPFGSYRHAAPFGSYAIN